MRGVEQKNGLGSPNKNGFVQFYPVVSRPQPISLAYLYTLGYCILKHIPVEHKLCPSQRKCNFAHNYFLTSPAETKNLFMADHTSVFVMATVR